jgi:hypothetical protein
MARSGSWRPARWRVTAITALLGLARRRDPAARDRADPWREASASSYEAPLDASSPLRFTRAAQLPPFGRGNGVEALFWTPVARLRPQQVDAVLEALGEQGIPAWAAPTRGDAMLDLSVGSERLNEAQDLLMRLLGTAQERTQNDLGADGRPSAPRSF